LKAVASRIAGFILMAIKSVMVHFQSKEFNPGCLLVYQLEDVGGGPTDKEIQIGRGKMRKWIKTMYVPESTDGREAFLPQREADTTKVHF
jgi:hypothetical protein